MADSNAVGVRRRGLANCGTTISLWQASGAASKCPRNASGDGIGRLRDCSANYQLDRSGSGRVCGRQQRSGIQTPHATSVNWVPTKPKNSRRIQKTADEFRDEFLTPTNRIWRRCIAAPGRTRSATCSRDLKLAVRLLAWSIIWRSADSKGYTAPDVGLNRPSRICVDRLCT
jgi:hypothetical protein